MQNKTRIDQLVEALAGAWPRLDATEQRVAVALYRTLAEGSPVDPSQLEPSTGVDETVIRETIDSWTGVFRDDRGRIEGFWGLAIAEMAHRFEVDGVEIYTWCAYDPLFIAPLLGKPGRVESKDPVTGEIVSLTVTPDGVAAVSPHSTVVSFLTPDEPWGQDVIQTFCHYVHFFAGRSSGEQWVDQHSGTRLFSVEDAFEIGRRTNLLTLGDALGLGDNEENKNDSFRGTHAAIGS